MINNTAINQAGFANRPIHIMRTHINTPSTRQIAQRGSGRLDQIHASEKSLDMSASAISFRQSLINSGMTARYVSVESGNSSWMAAVTPDGIWKMEADGGVLEIDPDKGLPGVAQSIIRELEQLRQMLAFLPPEHKRAVASPQSEWSETRGVIETIVFERSEYVSVKDRLFAMANAFAELRSGFDNNNQQMQLSQNAFRFLVGNDDDLIAQMMRMNLPGGSAIGLDANAIAQMRLDAQNQLDAFVDAFLDNFVLHGAEGAFEIAWAAVWPEQENAENAHSDPTHFALSEIFADAPKAEAFADAPKPEKPELLSNTPKAPAASDGNETEIVVNVRGGRLIITVGDNGVVTARIVRSIFAQTDGSFAESTNQRSTPESRVANRYVQNLVVS